MLFEFRVLSFVTISVFYVLIILFCFFIRKERGENRFLTKLLSIYLITVIILLFFSVKLNEKDLVTLFFHPYTFLAYFMGFVPFLLSKKSLKFIKLVSRYIVFILPILTILDLLIFKAPIILVNCYSFLLFYILTAKNIKEKLFTGLLLLCSLPIFIIYDYRSGLLIISLFLCGLIASKVFEAVQSKVFRFVFLTSALTFIYFLFFNFTEIFDYLSSSIKSDIINTNDTRSFLFLEFFSEFKGSDYFIGRGYLGTYYSPYFAEWNGEGGDYYNRLTVEVGFLQLILKGGIILFGITLMVFMKSIYNGIIKHRTNSFKFLLGLWLLIEFAMLSIENIPFFGVHYFFIWILIAILNKKEGKY